MKWPAGAVNLLVVIGICLIGIAYYSGAKFSEIAYDNGIVAGERTGFDKGYNTCWNGLGMHWLGSRNRFLEFSKEHGNVHNTPWDKFVIEEKAIIAMYGGSGSKLEPEEIEEWVSKYGR